jgi:hypothetical protein
MLQSSKGERRRPSQPALSRTWPPFSAPIRKRSVGASGGAANVSAIVWTECTAIAQRMLKLDDTRLACEIARRLGNHLGAVRVVGRRWSSPLSALHAHRSDCAAEPGLLRRAVQPGWRIEPAAVVQLPYERRTGGLADLPKRSKQ